MAAGKKNTTHPVRGFVSRVISLGLLAIPAAAIWHPSTYEGGWANILVFWSWLYVPFGLFLQVALLLVCFKSKDPEWPAKVKKMERRKYWRALGFVIGGVWTFGAVYRGWMATGCLLAFGWIVGPIISVVAFYEADKALEKIASADDDGKGAPPAEAITEEQVVLLGELMETKGTDIVKFTKFFKISKVSELPESKYERAVALLQRTQK